MKRNQPQQKYKPRDSGQTTSHMIRMPRDERGYVRKFLDPESKINLSYSNRVFHGESSKDKDIHCFKQTNKYAACTGVFLKMTIAGECLDFCKKHVNQVMATLINIMFSGHLYTRRYLIEGDEGDEYTPTDIENEYTSMAHPTMLVQRFNEFDSDILFEFVPNDLKNVNTNQTVGDYVLRQFDFTSSSWEEISFEFKGLGHGLVFDFQQKKWQIDYDDDKVKVTNENYIKIETEPELESDYEYENEGDQQHNMEMPD
jgi:hypothetical protein